jgi:hypothetical protein
MTLNVQYHFRRTFCCGEKVVRLKTLDACKGEKRVCLSQCDHIVWHRIDSELTRIEILHNVLIAQFREVSDAVDVFGKIRPIFQAKPVPIGRNILSRHVRLIYVRVLIINVKGF